MDRTHGFHFDVAIERLLVDNFIVRFLCVRCRPIETHYKQQLIHEISTKHAHIRSRINYVANECVGYDDDVHGLTMPDYGLSVFLLIFYGLLLLVLLERLNNYWRFSYLFKNSMCGRYIEVPSNLLVWNGGLFFHQQIQNGFSKLHVANWQNRVFYWTFSFENESMSTETHYLFNHLIFRIRVYHAEHCSAFLFHAHWIYSRKIGFYFTQQS